ncbi:uncharacterized protein [Rutidosis leptorrhynchoides]|uniref:uncharacterized protein n=1 Tax=Rutidosis leptorrhynchoides TaxID=125765 RepID=UPI003A99B0B1
MVKEIKILHLRAFVDSQLVSNQIKGTFEAKQPTIQQYLSKAKELIESFKSFDIEHVRRSQNKKADALSKLASLTFEHLAKEVLVEVLERKYILEEEVNDLIQKDEVTWMTPLQVYLETGKLPEDKNEARKIRIKEPSYKMMNGALYKRSFLTPWLRCVGPKQATVIIQEMHEGICGLHASPRSVVAKIMRLRYYWPTMHHDITMVLQTCESCQIHSNVPRLPKQELISVTSASPFMKWGIDIVGPINDTPGSPTFLLVAIDYFTKWDEAKPLAAITGKQIEKFVWEHIVCRFGVPQEIVSDNGKQFAEGIFPKFPAGSEKVNQCITDVEREAFKPQSLLQAIKNSTKLHLSISSPRTTPKRSNGETSYSLAYGTEAVLPRDTSANRENNEQRKHRRKSSSQLGSTRGKKRGSCDSGGLLQTKDRRLLQQESKALNLQSRRICPKVKQCKQSGIRRKIRTKLGRPLCNFTNAR